MLSSRASRVFMLRSTNLVGALMLLAIKRLMLNKSSHATSLLGDIGLWTSLWSIIELLTISALAYKDNTPPIIIYHKRSEGLVLASCVYAFGSARVCVCRCLWPLALSQAPQQACTGEVLA